MKQKGLAMHVLGENHFMPARSPSPPKKYIVKTKNVSPQLGKKGALARHVLGKNRFMPTRRPPPFLKKQNLRRFGQSDSPPHHHHRPYKNHLSLCGIRLTSSTRPRHQKFYFPGYCLKTPSKGAPKGIPICF